MSAVWGHPPRHTHARRRRRMRRPVRVAVSATIWLATLAAACVWPMVVVSTAERVAGFYFVGIFVPAVWLAATWEKP